jgi:hypothetical protein
VPSTFGGVSSRAIDFPRMRQFLRALSSTLTGNGSLAGRLPARRNSRSGR